MTPRTRPQQRYDHRLRDLVHHTGDVTLATDLGVPRSTARGWLCRAPEVVVSLDVTHLSELDLQQEIRQLRRRVQKLAALLRLVLMLLRASGFTLAGERLPDGHDKLRILGAVNRARRVRPVAGAAAVPAGVAASVPCVATTADGVCARRPVVLSAHVAASTDAR